MEPRASSMVWNFYPRPPRGGRQVAAPEAIQPKEFLSTPSARRATAASARFRSAMTVFLSTPSARRATTRTIWM